MKEDSMSLTNNGLGIYIYNYVIFSLKKVYLYHLVLTTILKPTTTNIGTILTLTVTMTMTPMG